MIDPSQEQLLPLSSAPTHPMLRRGRRVGKPIHRSTLERWRLRGVRGVRLDTILLGGLRCTSVEALERFFHELNNPSARTDTPTPSQVRRAHFDAEQELNAAGM